MEIELHAAGSLRCRLVDTSGAPVMNGFLRAYVRGHGSAQDTTEDGVYLLPQVPAGAAEITAGFEADDLPLVRTRADIAPGGVTDLGTLVLGDARVVAGQVTDARGRAVGGALVSAGDRDWETWSHADGSFRLALPPWFAGRVLARKPGHGATHAPAGPDMRLALRPEGRVLLTVRVPPRVRALSLAARDPGTGFRWSPEWRREADRTYLVTGLPPGRLVLIVATMPPEGETEVDVRAGQTVPATVVVPE